MELLLKMYELYYVKMYNSANATIKNAQLNRLKDYYKKNIKYIPIINVLKI